MKLPFNPDTAKCEACRKAAVDRFNETVRNKNTGVARIMNICNPCLRRITGVK